ncbi:hypothetical protein RLIN73S_06214 [Rhodanobacter lindaniclasticus]
MSSGAGVTAEAPAAVIATVTGVFSARRSLGSSRLDRATEKPPYQPECAASSNNPVLLATIAASRTGLACAPAVVLST